MTLFMGVDTSVFFVDENKRKAMRSELGLSDSDTLVILSGRLTRAKKIHEIVGCLKDLAQEDIYFVFVGHIDQGYFQEIIGTCGELLSAKKFRFIPPLSRERLAEIYNASDFALWPFHMSVGILEAMSCGATVLTNKEARDYYESIPESAVIDDGLNGFVNRILIGHKLDNLEDRKRNRELNARSMSSLSYDHLARRTMSLLRCENIGSI
jgi:glycosyltransferase involved in cell wall biosynthesis